MQTPGYRKIQKYLIFLLRIDEISSDSYKYPAGLFCFLGKVIKPAQF